MAPTATNDDTVTGPSLAASTSEGNERSSERSTGSKSGAATTAPVLPRQKKNSHDDRLPPAKRQKRSSVGEEMICSISLELPVDPVHAEDGHLYERESILRYFKGKTGDQVKSPLTREIMGKKLLPAPHITNIIRQLIEDEVITGDSAQKWKTKIKQKEEKDQLEKKATDGDVAAMMELGARYYFGRDGKEKDYAEAFSWFKKAHTAGHMKATAMLGNMLVRGRTRGVEVDTTKGVAYLGRASNASDLAAFRLGAAFAHGRYGLKVDKEEAICLLELVVGGKCTYQHLNDKGKKAAIELLKDLKGP